MSDYIQFIDILNRSTPKTKFYIITFLIISIYLSTFITLNFNINFILSIVLSILVIYYKLSNNETDLYGNNNLQLDFKLSKLNEILLQKDIIEFNGKRRRVSKYLKNSYLYLDPDCINLLFSCLEYSIYGPEKFFKVLKFLNELLTIKYQMKYITIDYVQNYYIARHMASNTINYFIIHFSNLNYLKFG